MFWSAVLWVFNQSFLKYDKENNKLIFLYSGSMPAYTCGLDGSNIKGYVTDKKEGNQKTTLPLIRENACYKVKVLN